MVLTLWNFPKTYKIHLDICRYACEQAFCPWYWYKQNEVTPDWFKGKEVSAALASKFNSKHWKKWWNQNPTEKESIGKFSVVKQMQIDFWMNFKSWRCVVLRVTWNRFSVKKLPIDSLLISYVVSSYLNTDMCNFESSQKDESRAQSADSSKAYSTPTAFDLIIPWKSK